MQSLSGFILVLDVVESVGACHRFVAMAQQLRLNTFYSYLL